MTLRIEIPPQVHTIDVETATGWVRLELTEDQAAQLRDDLAHLPQWWATKRLPE